MMYKALMFDLDGTILHTISDITIALNTALKTCGYNFSYNDEETTKLIGMGAHTIIARVFKNQEHTKKDFDLLYAEFQRNYQKFQGMYATPFEGITELLKQLKKENKLLFVVSNKPDHLAKIIVEHYFPTTFDLIYGHQEHLPEKPNPYLIDLIVNKYQLNKEEVLFIGDSDVDYLTAKNGQVPFCLVMWGYGDYQKEFVKDSQFIAYNVHQLKDIIYK